MDGTGVVQFAAAHLMPRVSRNSDQSRTAVVRQALAATTGRARGRTRFRYRDGIEGVELYAQAAQLDGYLIVVAVTDHAPWERDFTLPLARTGPRPSSRICAHPECGGEFTSFERPCARCGVPTCPACGRCGCVPTVKEKTCPGCWTRYPLAYFDGDRCKDCA